MTVTTMNPTAKEKHLENIGAQFRWDSVSEPGTYYSNWSGHMIRLPDYALKQGFSPVVEILGQKPMIVTKLSGDPFMPISKARMVAANLDLDVGF